MWDIKYRPLRFTDVLGQEGNVQLLKSRLKRGTAFDTSYIFAGGWGRGKTTLSRIHARAMLCLNLDKSDPEPCNECINCTAILSEQPCAFSERDSASQGTIEHVRAILEELPFVIANAPKRIYLFDEAHRMGVASQDVLLKPIEEKKMVGIFCTTEAEKIRGAIRSRCEEYTIRQITREDILKRMRQILTSEGVEFQDEAVYIVIDHSGGHVRDVINKLEMISQLGPITVESVREYLHLSVVTLYYEILLNLDNPSKVLGLIDKACDMTSPEAVCEGIAEAAMNAFRVANGMFADFTYVDKALADGVWAKYQANVVRFSHWFLNTRYPSKLSLSRDVLLLSQNQGNLPSELPSAPVVFVSSAASQIQPQVQAQPQTPPPAPQTQVQAALPAQPVTPAVTPPPKQPIGYADPTLPTKLEESVMSKAFPRVRSQTQQEVPVNARPARQMSPVDWRRQFDNLLQKKPPVSLSKV